MVKIIAVSYTHLDVYKRQVLEMKDLSNFVGVDFEKYFGKLDIEDNDYKTVY